MNIDNGSDNDYSLLPEPRLKEGDRVRLAAFEDQPEQTGEIIDVDYDDGMVWVQLDEGEH